MREIASSRVTSRALSSFGGTAARSARIASTTATVSVIASHSGDRSPSCGSHVLRNADDQWPSGACVFDGNDCRARDAVPQERVAADVHPRDQHLHTVARPDVANRFGGSDDLRVPRAGDRGGNPQRRSSIARVTFQTVNEGTTIEDSRPARRPNGAGHPEPGLGPVPPVALGTDPVLPRVLTPDELAKVLRVRRRSVYEAISRGDIPGVRRIGRKVRIDRDSVLAWMADGHGRAPRSSRR